MEEMFQCSQCVTRWSGHPGEWFYIWGSVFVSAVVISGSQQAVAVAKSLGELWSMLLNPCITSITATMAALFMDPIGQWQEWLRKEATVHRMGHPIYLIIELLSRSHFLMSVYMGHKYLYILCPFGEIYAHTSSTDVFLTYFHDSFQVPDHLANLLALSPWISKNHTSGHFSFRGSHCWFSRQWRINFLGQRWSRQYFKGWYWGYYFLR